MSLRSSKTPALRLTRDVQSQRTRARILEAAARIFARDGLSAARTLEVAREAQVSHGAIFVHFPTREALQAAAIEAVGGEVAARTHALAQSGGGVAEVLQAHLAGLCKHETFYARLVSESPLLPPIARSTLVAIQSAVAVHLSAALEREQAAGKVRRLPLAFLFNTWLGLLHHYLLNRALFAPGGSVLARHGPELVRSYSALISC
jgi:AcrR family transcriptional regulator